MTTSKQPWTYYLQNNVHAILDAQGNWIGSFNLATDAELVVDQQTRILELETGNNALENEVQELKERIENIREALDT